jgi:hypothetical protein
MKVVTNRQFWIESYYIKGLKKRLECKRLQSIIDDVRRQAKKELERYENALQSIFTPKQISVLLTGKKKAEMEDEDIAKAITLRYQSNPYEPLRSMNFPLPSSRTLRRWTAKITMKQGVIHSAIEMLRKEFENATDFQRHCVMGFDEIAIESSLVYDPEEDKVYGPKTNMNVWFARGLFQRWKIPIAFGFDEKLSSTTFLDLIICLENAGLRVIANVNDLGGKNRGLWKQLGISALKSADSDDNKCNVKASMKNPSSGRNLWFFADAPHLIKLLRNNLLKHGVTLDGGCVCMQNERTERQS